MNRREFLAAAAAAIPAGCAARFAGAAEPTRRRPNIVYLFADQMRNHALGCMGNEQVKTPNIDALARDGLLVTNCISSHPVCTPYRGQLMTGQYGCRSGVMRNDIRLPDDTTVLPEALKQAGYTTGYIGKWHLSGDRKNPVDAHNRRGWDFWAVRNCSHQHFTPRYWLNDAEEATAVEGWEPDIQTDLACEFISRQKDGPFCLAVSYGPPHNPYRAPDKYAAMYDADTLTLRSNTPDDGSTRENIRHYYGMVTSLDDCVGRITAELKKAGVWKDTVFIFTSDHGDMLGAQGHRMKQRPWEESINVPLVLTYPRKVRAGQRRDWQIDSVDMMPTLLGLANAEIPPNVQGMNHVDLITGKGDTQRQASLLLNTNTGSGPGSDWRGVWTRQWTYAYHCNGDWVLYDLTNDPEQLHNLVDNEKHKDQLDELRALTNRLREQAGDGFELQGKTPAPIRLPA